MNKRSLIQIGTVIAFAAALWLAFPFVARYIEGAALSLRRFWWVILLFVMTGWAVWTLSKRNPK